MKNRNRLLVGSAFSLAAIAVAVDHTRHRLPEPVPVIQEQGEMSDESPCGLNVSPCGLDATGSPCSMSDDGSDVYDSSPCGLGD